MEQIPCVYCGEYFDPSPRHKNQTACKNDACQKAKKAAWQRFKMKTDPAYSANQKSSQQQWVKNNPGYWKSYRKKNPEKSERNRILQAQRNRMNRSSEKSGNAFPRLIAKMDASESDTYQVLGRFWLVPVIAKMDALKVNIIKIPTDYT